MSGTLEEIALGIFSFGGVAAIIEFYRGLYRIHVSYRNASVSQRP